MKNRKPNRWAEWNYSNEGYYFVTICTKNRNPVFGKMVITNPTVGAGIPTVGAGLRPAPTVGFAEMVMNEFGNIVYECWNELPKHYMNFELDEFIVMPDHIHGIVIIKQKGIHTLSHFIGSLKSFSSRKINQVSKMDPIWQRSFHDRIIRNEVELFHVRNYIRNNPQNWVLDKLKKVA